MRGYFAMRRGFATKDLVVLAVCGLLLGAEAVPQTASISMQTMVVKHVVFDAVATPSADLTQWTLPEPAASVSVYRNGMRQKIGIGRDYLLSGAVITFAAGVIQPDDVMVFDYVSE